MYMVIKGKNLMTEKSWQVDPIMNVIILWNPHWFRPLFSFFFLPPLLLLSRHHRVATLSIIFPDWMVFHYGPGWFIFFFFLLLLPSICRFFFLFINRDDSKIHIHTSSPFVIPRWLILFPEMLFINFPKYFPFVRIFTGV